MSTGRALVFLEHLCPECSTTFSSPTALINHLKTSHSIQLSPRKTGRKRPTHSAYIYVKNKEDAQFSHSDCPSCWEHFPIDDVRELSDHIRMAHLEADELQDLEEGRQHSGDSTQGAEEYVPPTNNGNRSGGSKKSTNEEENDDIYTKKSKELFNTLDDLVANFKKLLAYGGSNDKDNKNSS